MIEVNKYYRTIVVDPPWPMKKSDVYKDPDPEMDYPVMSISEIKSLPVYRLVDPFHGAHVYLWTTHRFLPEAFKVLEAWNCHYHVCLTWIKSGGFTPFSFQFTTEFVLFSFAKGKYSGSAPPLLKQALRTDFHGRRREHSRKPDEFYDLVRQVSPEPRIDLFSRVAHLGFDQWGDETDRFQSSQIGMVL